MNVFHSRSRDRLIELLEWIDYRRDASLWPFLLLPPLLSVAWAYGGVIGLGIVVAFGMGVAVFATIATCCAVGVWILGNAALDALRVLIEGSAAPTRVRVRVPATSR